MKSPEEEVCWVENLSQVIRIKKYILIVKMCTGGIISSRDLLEQNLIARKHVGFVELSRHSLNGFLTEYVNLQVSTGMCRAKCAIILHC